MTVTPRLLQVGAFFLSLHASYSTRHHPQADKCENASENSLKSSAKFYVSLKENVRFSWRKRTFRVRETYVSASGNVKHTPWFLEKQKKNNPFTPEPPDKRRPMGKKMVHKGLPFVNHLLHLYTVSYPLTYQFCSSIDLAIPISSPLSSANPLRRPRQE